MNGTAMLRIIAMTALLSAFTEPALADEIHDLSQRGDLEGVKALIERDPGLVNARDNDSRTPLHWACCYGHIEIMRFLLDHGSDVNAGDKTNLSALHDLAMRNNTEGIELLLDKGADIGAKEFRGKTALHFAAMHDAREAAALLIKNGADIDGRDDYQRTALILCAREGGGPETARILISAGADVNAVDKFRSTSLELAAWRGKEKLIDVLIDSGAEIPSEGYQIAGLMIQAASKGLTRLFDALVTAGGDPSFTLPSGGTLLNPAATGGSVEILDKLIARGLDINEKDNYGWTPLHYASRDGRVNSVRRLLSGGAATETRNVMGQSPLNVADEMKHPDVRAALIENGAKDEPISFPVLKGEYLGQEPPGAEPKLFAPGIVSSIWGLHSSAAFSPDGKTVMWTPMVEIPDRMYAFVGILVSEIKKGCWTPPFRTSFTDDEKSDVPFFSPDGKRIYFISNKSLPGEQEEARERIWYAERKGRGWSEPKAVDPSVNDFPHHWQFSVDNRHTICFSSGIPGGQGKNDIYISRLVDGGWQKPENMGPPVNTADGEETPFLAPDGSYLIFSRLFDLYISYRKEDGGWMEPENLGTPINSDEIELCPIVTPDGKYMFYLSQRGGESHIWWVDAGFIRK